MLDNLRIAIVCDWLTVYAGAERVVLALHELFPNAPIYTSLYRPSEFPDFKDADVRESKLSRLPFSRRLHRLMVPLMPRHFESMDFSEYDLVISSSHSVAKGIVTQPGTLHVCYCHSPMRYVWDHSHSYQKNYKNFSALRFLYKPILHKLRMWDRLAAERVDHFIANSNYVKSRIQKYYGREASVVHPPVQLDDFSPAENSKRTRYLALGRLIPYKRFDLVVDAFNDLDLPLHIIGDGPELKRLKRQAGKNIQFLGHVSHDELLDELRHSKALIFPQLEDFGIVPLEAMATGTPVLAYGHGGALETVSEGVSGLFFKDQEKESLKKVVLASEKKKWNSDEISESVAHFSVPHFKTQILKELESAWKDHLMVIS